MSNYNPTTHKAWYEKNAEKKKKYARDRYWRDPAKRIEASKNYRAARPGCWVESHRKRLYGIDTAEFIRMSVAQFNQCAICEINFDPKEKNTKPHVDHDHTTGKVRGILCGPCNTALGRMERPNFLKPALGYLGISVL
jgi:hypothetical protein